MDYKSGSRGHRSPSVPNLSQRGFDYQHTEDASTATLHDLFLAILILTVLLCGMALVIRWLP